MLANNNENIIIKIVFIILTLPEGLNELFIGIWLIVKDSIHLP